MRRLLAPAAILAVGTVPATAPAQAVPKATYEVEGSFQLPARGQPGAPDEPRALALAPDGTIHIADKGKLVFVYDAQGVYRRSYGAQRLDRPVALEVRPNGESYVLDEGRKQIFVFGPGGQALRTLVGGGGRAGELSDPVDFALGPSGYLYVLDAGRKSVQIFSADGLFVRELAPAGVLGAPTALAVGNDGAIYIADKAAPTHVFRYPAFTELPWVGPLPRGIAARIPFRGARFDEPVAVAVNRLGTVLVLDEDQGRVWGNNPNSEGQIGPNDAIYGGSGTGRGSFREAVDVAFDGDRAVLILDSDLRKVERIRLTTQEGLRPRPDFHFPIRVTHGARSLPVPILDFGYTPDGEARLLVAVEGRVTTLLGTQRELHATVYGDTVPAYLPNPRAFQQQFSREIGDVAGAVLTDSSVIVLDSRRDRFAIFGLDGSLKGTFGDNYRDQRRLDDPEGIALLPDGRIVICDTGNDRVKIFSADLASLVGSYPVAKPYGVAISPQGAIFIWNEDGDQIARLLTGEGQLEPLDEDLLPGPVRSLTFDRAGNLLALDRDTDRITIVEAGFEQVLMQLGREDGLDDPERVVVDGEGNIYVADRGRTRVFRWDVRFPPLAGFNPVFGAGGVELSWSAGPSRFIDEYVIQGAATPDGPYRTVASTRDPSFRLQAENLAGPVPQYVRVAPRFITGTTGSPTRPVPLFNFTAAAAYEAGDYPAAMADAHRAMELIASGQLKAEPTVRAELLWYGFAAGYELTDFGEALGFGQQLFPLAVDHLPRTRLIEFLFKLAEVQLRTGQAQGASQSILTLVGQGPRPEYYTDRAVVEQSFRIYRALEQAGMIPDGLEFLRQYENSIPTAIPGLKGQYGDSITVFATRYKLAPGFEAWRNANVGQAVSFFEDLLLTAGLSAEQKIVARQVLAAAYYAFGRRSEAEDTFREIYSVRPNFDLSSEIKRVKRLYGLTIYNPETRKFFGQFGPGT